MKKLLLILLCLPTIGFGQANFKLGNYTKLSKNNIDFNFMKPLPPFSQSNKSLSMYSGTDDKLVVSFLAPNPAALQIYSTPIPSKMQDEADEFLNSKEAVKSFVNQLFPPPVNKVMEHKIVFINGKKFLNIKFISADVQKNINWITFYKNHMINIVCTTLIDDFEEMLPFINKFNNSIIIK
jgi:hypothetical protein